MLNTLKSTAKNSLHNLLFGDRIKSDLAIVETVKTVQVELAPYAVFERPQTQVIDLSTSIDKF